jgi:threonine dehydrogenase-like Zn-dependent dehydrogenase
MRGVVPIGNGRIEIREIPDPQPGPGEAVVAVRAAGVCGSDLHAYKRTWEQLGERQGLVIGHEAGGVVAAVGQGVDAGLVGRRVSVYHYRGCGICRHCLAGNVMLCETKRGYGWHVHGADAEMLLTDARNCCTLPDTLTYEDGAILACAAGTAYSALRRLEAVTGECYLAVFGLGPVGLTAALLAQAKGWRVVGIDRSAARCAFAESQGVSVLRVEDDDETAAAALDRQHGALPRRVFDATGSEGGLAAAISAVGVFGMVVTVGKGMWPLRFSPTLDVAELIRRQAAIVGSWVLPIHQVADMIDLMASADLSFSGLVTHRFPIDRAQEAFDTAAQDDTVGKVILES